MGLASQGRRPYETAGRQQRCQRYESLVARSKNPRAPYLLATSSIPLDIWSTLVSSRMILSTTKSSSKNPNLSNLAALCRLDGAEAGRTMLPPPPSQESLTYSADALTRACPLACKDADIGLFLLVIVGGLATQLRIVDCRFKDNQSVAAIPNGRQRGPNEQGHLWQTAASSVSSYGV
jgi:hypothetical protein